MEKLVDMVLGPLARRIGSMGAGAIVVLGATAAQADQLEAAIVAFVLITCDLLLSNLQKRRAGK